MLRSIGLLPYLSAKTFGSGSHLWGGGHPHREDAIHVILMARCVLVPVNTCFNKKDRADVGQVILPGSVHVLGLREVLLHLDHFHHHHHYFASPNRCFSWSKWSDLIKEPAGPRDQQPPRREAAAASGPEPLGPLLYSSPTLSPANPLSHLTLLIAFYIPAHGEVNPSLLEEGFQASFEANVHFRITDSAGHIRIALFRLAPIY